MSASLKQKNNVTHPKTDKRKTRLFFTGLTMGLADLVPGVSGGTIAFLFGIYDELLYTIKLMTGPVPKLILARKFKEAHSLIPFGFLIPLFCGIALAIFGLVHIVSHLLKTQPVHVWALFFGLVIGSAFVVSRRVTKWTVRRALLMLLGFVLTFFIVGLPSVGGIEAPWAIFGTGAIAITAMILPGISGSLIMVLLGQYKIIIDAVAERDFVVLATFATGAVLGLALSVRLLTWLLKHYHVGVIAFLVGVMAGSLRRIWPWQTIEVNDHVTNVLPPVNGSLLWAALLVIAGFVMVIILEKVGIAKEHDDINTRDYRKELKDIRG